MKKCKGVKGLKEFKVFKVPLFEGVGGVTGYATRSPGGADGSSAQTLQASCLQTRSYRVRKCPTCVEGETPSNRRKESPSVRG